MRLLPSKDSTSKWGAASLSSLSLFNVKQLILTLWSWKYHLDVSNHASFVQVYSTSTKNCCNFPSIVNNQELWPHKVWHSHYQNKCSWTRMTIFQICQDVSWMTNISIFAPPIYFWNISTTLKPITNNSIYIEQSLKLDIEMLKNRLSNNKADCKTKVLTILNVCCNSHKKLSPNSLFWNKIWSLDLVYLGCHNEVICTESSCTRESYH